MADARGRILGAIAAALGPARTADAIAAEAAALLADPDAIRPALVAPSLADAFAERITRPQIGGTVARVRSLAALPGEVDRYRAAHGLTGRVAVQPTRALAALDWSGMAVAHAVEADEAIAVGLAEWGVAETGSLVFRSGAETPVLFHFLPLHHVVALPERAIVAHLEDLAAAVAAAGAAPRNLNLITGPSGTTDIEGSYVRGAHGPGFLHVVLVEGD